MAEARSDQEPSIEEILASIREIISDDDAPKGDDAAPAAAPEAAEIPDELPAAIEAPEPEAAPAPAPEPAPASAPAAGPAADDDDILDLGSFAEAPTTPSMPEEKKSALEGIDFDKPKVMTVDFTEPEPEAPEPVPEPAPEPAAPAIEPEQPEPAYTPPAPAAVLVDADSLLSDATKAATLDSLSRLAQNIAISRAGNGGTLEDIVREMLKPMLRDWLERNLPPMIERMVERELERMVKQAMDR